MIPLRSLTCIVAAISVAPLAAGCGGSSTPPKPHRSTLGYVECMHSHGVPSFPDPGPRGGIDKDKIIALGNGPQINRASNVCQHLMPTSGFSPSGSEPPPQIQTAALLALARCLRSHGFPRFPDPTRSGQLTQAMIVAAGIDLHQPALVQAADGCVGATHGAITRAAVARFIAGE
jgi:hypothetical protein